jgi:hypothetical protein
MRRGNNCGIEEAMSFCLCKMSSRCNDVAGLIRPVCRRPGSFPTAEMSPSRRWGVFLRATGPRVAIGLSLMGGCVACGAQTQGNAPASVPTTLPANDRDVQQGNRGVSRGQEKAPAATDAASGRAGEQGGASKSASGTPGAVPSTAPAAPPPGPTGRPRIGLALGGGGALALSEIGALEWFEDHHIPVDMIAGTSMGGMWGRCMRQAGRSVS